MKKADLTNRIKKIDAKIWKIAIIACVFIAMFISAYNSSIFNLTRAERIILQHITDIEDSTQPEILPHPERPQKHITVKAAVPFQESEKTFEQDTDPAVSPEAVQQDTAIEEEPVKEDVLIKTPKPAETEASDIYLPDSPTEKKPVVNIDTLTIEQIDGKKDLALSFNLINNTEDNRPVSGYVFVYAVNRSDKRNVYGIWPPAEHNSGIPENVTEGDNFIIRYYLPKQGRILHPGSGDDFDHITVVVYSEEGNILFKKEIDMDE